MPPKQKTAATKQPTAAITPTPTEDDDDAEGYDEGEPIDVDTGDMVGMEDVDAYYADDAADEVDDAADEEPPDVDLYAVTDDMALWKCPDCGKPLKRGNKKTPTFQMTVDKHVTELCDALNQDDAVDTLNSAMRGVTINNQTPIPPQRTTRSSARASPAPSAQAPSPSAPTQRPTAPTAQQRAPAGGAGAGRRGMFANPNDATAAPQAQQQVHRGPLEAQHFVEAQWLGIRNYQDDPNVETVDSAIPSIQRKWTSNYECRWGCKTPTGLKKTFKSKKTFMEHIMEAHPKIRIAIETPPDPAQQSAVGHQHPGTRHIIQEIDPNGK
jgi:hypothetical protein